MIEALNEMKNNKLLFWCAQSLCGLFADKSRTYAAHVLRHFSQSYCRAVETQSFALGSAFGTNLGRSESYCSWLKGKIWDLGETEIASTLVEVVYCLLKADIVIRN